MRIATWNINSIKVRLDRVLGFLEELEPDALCLQELKVADEAFPYEAIEASGYHAVVYGQRTYNGVAILSRQEPASVIRGMGEEDTDPQARLISADVGGVRVFSAYFPNGESVGAEKWGYKLAWMGQLRVWIDRTGGQRPLSPLGPERPGDHPGVRFRRRLRATPPRGTRVHVVGLPATGVPQERRATDRPHLRDRSGGQDEQEGLGGAKPPEEADVRVEAVGPRARRRRLRPIGPPWLMNVGAR